MPGFRAVPVGVLMLAAMLATTAGRAESPQHQGWQSDFAAAQAAARAQHKPLLVHFYADWCGPCRAMESTILHTPDVLRHLGTSVIAVKVNSDHHPQLVSRYGVTALPMDVFVAPDGKVLGNSIGSSGKAAYVARIVQVAATTAAAGPQGVVQAQARTAPAVPQPAAVPGLQGYSPVTLLVEKRWQKGQPQFAAEHDGIVYHMASAAELQAFQASPARYAPQLRGNDPYLLSTRGEAVAGDIRYGAFFRGELYLHATAESRELFKAAPHRYANTVPVNFTQSMQ